MATRLEIELARLGVSTTHSRPEGISVYADPDLPRGWVRVSDGTGEVFGVVDALAKSLAKISEVDEDWQEVWDALGEVGENHAPHSSQGWPEDLIRFEQLEEGTCNDQPNTLVIVETNGGTRYAAGPHGAFSCALSDWFDNLGSLAETREAAIAIGCEVESTEEN